MNIPVLFATVEGHTGRLSRFITSELEAAGHDTTAIDLSDQMAPVSLEGADRVILAGSVHERRHPQSLEVFVTAQREDLSQRPSMMISVSLSAAFDEGMDEARDYLTEMEMRTGFRPQRELLVAGAVRTSRYDYFARQVIRHVVLRGKDIDPDKGEHDFTDYDALRSAILDFAGG
ncbi:protoporphyrinogen oxidase [Ponticoccus sp. SC2-23]|uniref:flavodoxin domain-containing protein n=1 Tax=Alexandriicola marinus TaxID=2081710 RepID=UPI000FDBA9C4|nr:flavodoxin domain-containing protein [Alexandriicola marinus]MBM1222188.1 protoporphyrinogen oxidase [Ponticoccus sp. SC6-9]MBM1226875.1 protoporphyrinogen oxidase [Ponticoccus sp. SC6-15]MBM1231135.1 protoporphyrinogen oxidase [Ponticoccus sp. SC6-38]MBM1235613.1 protoporphyrinogen oxidase [Ponticoccus sp. SC6-45]MBM1240157.1 protoporphyrinogen oxidase [Ponticoccus sp. SC6-49]MBM1244511.1 protoporphyrinogen oxidase [Ponticoccus sp. SC2-64]MBM1249087.1 protoporphyrinogen oxidase [Ponticoc